MKPRTLLLKEPLECGCLRYTFHTSEPVEPNTESEIVQCRAHKVAETVPPSDAVTAIDPIQYLMRGPAPREKEIERERRAANLMNIRLSEDDRGCPRYKSNSGTIAAISLLLLVVMCVVLYQYAVFSPPSSPFSNNPSGHKSAWENHSSSPHSSGMFIRAADADSSY